MHKSDDCGRQPDLSSRTFQNYSWHCIPTQDMHDWTTPFGTLIWEELKIKHAKACSCNENAPRQAHYETQNVRFKQDRIEVSPAEPSAPPRSRPNLPTPNEAPCFKSTFHHAALACISWTQVSVTVISLYHVFHIPSLYDFNADP